MSIEFMESLAQAASLPKLKKTEFIESFLREQSAHAKDYAVQGQALVSSWTPDLGSVLSVSPLTKPSPSLAIGFDTPILKPRAPKSVSAAGDVQKSSASANRRVDQSVIADSFSSQVKANSTSPAKLKQSNSTKTRTTRQSADRVRSKKRPPKSESDEEAEGRLTERRIRKRAKQAIMKPSVESDKVVKSTKRKLKSKDSTKKPNLPAALALMHGFTANNLGKNRLTQPALLRTGVFGKGKASERTVKRKTIKVSAKRFSEADFLNKASQGVVKHSLTKSDSGSSYISSTISSSTSALSAKQVSPQVCKVSEISNISGKSLKAPLEDSFPASSTDKLPIMSEVWDIESQPGFLPIASPARHKTPLQAASQVTKTIILATHPWEELRHSPNQHNCIQLASSASVDSIHPSDSASQCKWAQETAPIPPQKTVPVQTSRFFPTLKTQDTDQEKDFFYSPSPSPKPQQNFHAPKDNNMPSPENYSIELTESHRLHLREEFLSPSVHIEEDKEDGNKGTVTSFMPDQVFSDDDESDQSLSALIQHAQPTLGEDWQTELVLRQFPPQDPGMVNSDSDSKDEWISYETSDVLLPGCLDVSNNLYDIVENTTGLNDFTFQNGIGMQVDVPYSQVTNYDYGYVEMNLGCDGEFVEKEEGEYWEDGVPDMESAEALSACSDPHSGSFMDGNDVPSIVGMSQKFLQGRALLLGLPMEEARDKRSEESLATPMSQAEEDVARSMKRHWFPHRL